MISRRSILSFLGLAPVAAAAAKTATLCVGAHAQSGPSQYGVTINVDGNVTGIVPFDADRVSAINTNFGEITAGALKRA